MNNNDVDLFVDQVYDELERLYGKDRNYQKGLLGNEPMKKIFDIYGDWLAVNTMISPKVAANTIYRDVIKVGYLDFARRQIKRGVQVQGMPSFNVIYGTQKEIDQASKILAQLKTQNPQKFDTVMLALQKVKEVSDGVKPSPNIFGKATNLAKQQAVTMKLPKLATLNTFMSMNDGQLRSYVGKLHNAAKADTDRKARQQQDIKDKKEEERLEKQAQKY